MIPTVHTAYRDSDTQVLYAVQMLVTIVLFKAHPAVPGAPRHGSEMHIAGHGLWVGEHLILTAGRGSLERGGPTALTGGGHKCRVGHRSELPLSLGRQEIP